MAVSHETSGINVEALVLSAITPQPTERSVRYAKRLDDHLAALPTDQARRDFLAADLSKWFERYEQWAHAVDSGRLEPGPGTPTAFDYLITISDIRARQARYEAVSA